MIPIQMNRRKYTKEIAVMKSDEEILSAIHDKSPAAWG